MAATDVNQGQPVRTLNNADVISALCDGTTTSQLLGIDASGRLTIKLDDGSGNVVTSQVSGAQRALDVGINVAGVQIDPRQIRALTTADVVTSNQGTAAATHTGYWWTRLTDGTSDIALAPASTAATATEAALVVALSPNSPIPAGSNLIGSVNQGTSPWITKDEADGAISGGTAAAFSALAGGIFGGGLTLTSGQQAAIQLDATGALVIRNLTAASDTVVSNQGTAGTAAQGWFAKITDGTNTAAVKASTTPAASTDPALVVALSPNSPLPAGTNVLGSVNQGTSPWVTSDLADGAISGGTAGTKSMLGGAIYNSSALTLTTGQQAALQADVNGNLKVNLETPLPAGSNTIGNTNLYIGGSTNSASNPAFVTITSSTPGTPINDYFASTSNVAVGSSDTHTHAIASGKTFNGKKFWASSSLRIRIDVQVFNGTTISTVFTGFNSVSDPNITIDLDEFYVPNSGTGATVSIVRYNEDNKPAAIYSTISGTEN